MTSSSDETGERPFRYDARLANRIELAWQDRWQAEGTFWAPNPVGELAAGFERVAGRPKAYILDFFPYPSGAGLHVGHPLGYIGTDVLCRFLRMTGHNVLHAFGYDAFGLPAEQYAISTGQHPAITTKRNIETMRRQLLRLGLGYDTRREFATADPRFYRWTQWIFLQIWGSWFDEERRRARPVAELVAEFEAGTRPPSGPANPEGKPWAALDELTRRRVVDGWRLAYIAEEMVNWSPDLGTVLANEEVTAEGRSDVGNYPVYRRPLRQWLLRITAYAERLVDDLDRVDWPEPIKVQQRNWIGPSDGAVITFDVDGTAGLRIEAFTTRPDTLPGATYLVLAPEHPLADALVADRWPPGTPRSWRFMPGQGDGDADADAGWSPLAAVRAYQRRTSMISDRQRVVTRDKTGMFTGAYAVNPATGGQIPVFLADYVLMGYGTGTIMAVPAHDERDLEFARSFGLPVTEVPADDLGGDSIDASIGWLERTGHGGRRRTYRLRDWLFSRQRYWGEPFPIVYDSDGRPHPLDEAALPVELPDVPDYSPVLFDPDDANSRPSPPLGKATDWVHVELDLGDGLKPYTRDTNVMPQWAGSSWYELRYTDPHNSERFCAKENEAYWMGPRPAEHGPQDPGGVDLYVGGAEHAVLHLLYSRFWHKVLYDLGHVSSREPYRRLINQGYIQAFAYTDSRGSYVPAEEVIERGGGFFYPGPDGEVEVFQEFGKIGKSLKNSISPDEICDEYGADTLRVYEMSMGPLEASRPWATKDVVGAHRFLQRVWRLVIDEQTGETRVADADESLGAETLRSLHRTIAGVSEDYAALRNNTATAKLIEYTNHLTKEHRDSVPRAAVEPLVLMLAPLAPHMAEELWSRLGHTTSLAHGPFPEADPAYLVEDTVEYPVQVNGKVRGRVVVAADADDDTLKAAAMADEKVQAFLAGAAPRKVIVVPGRLVNLVV